MKNVNILKDLQEIELPLPESLYNWPNLDTFDKKKLSRLIIELERCSFFSYVALVELKVMKKSPDTHHKSRVGRVTGTTPFFLFGLM